MQTQLQQQELELSELRLKLERERAERSLKNTELSRFSEFQSQNGAIEQNSRLSPKSKRMEEEISQYVEVGGDEPAIEDRSEQNDSDEVHGDQYQQNRSTLSFVENESAVRNSKKKKSRKTAGSSTIQKDKM